jgi:inhibitor of KinA
MEHRDRDYRIVNAGDSAVFVEFEERIDPAVNQRVVALARAIERERLGGVRDVVPTIRSVAVYFDPLHTDFDRLTQCLIEAASARDLQGEAAREPIRIPVYYGGAFGPDLDEVARFAGLTPDEVVARHVAPIYRVFMLGFMPGFAYMGIVDPAIAAPRRPSPRPRVPALSVGIAGGQTGVYPSETPGGWQLVGRALIEPFDPGRADPFLLKAGDAVQFHQVAPPNLSTTAR